MKKLVFMILALLIMMGCANISEDKARMDRTLQYYEEEVQNFPGGIQ